MTICYFGDFDPTYSRNRILIEGFRQNGAKVLICNDRAQGFKKYFNLAKPHKKIADKYDLLFVGFGSRPVAIFAKLISKKPIIWDAFNSLHDSRVLDRKLVKPYSLRAGYYWFLDWICCKLADKILLDTNEHIKYFVKTFKAKKDKFIKVLIGADDSIFYPRK